MLKAMLKLILIGLGFFIGLPMQFTAAACDPNASITHISTALDGSDGNGMAVFPSISPNGRYVAYVSDSSNLVAGDNNSQHDVFMYDRITCLTVRISVTSGGNEGNGGARLTFPSLSSDGHYVAFVSEASNLVEGDSNRKADVFVHDLQSGQTLLVSRASDGTQGNGEAVHALISGDGRYVMFDSFATNLVSGDVNNKPDVFLRDLQSGETRRISSASNGDESNGDSSLGKDMISADGQTLLLASNATNLAANDLNLHYDVFLHDLQSGQTGLAALAPGGAQVNPNIEDGAISDSGQMIAFASTASNLVSGDNNNQRDIFVLERQTGQISRVSVSSLLAESNGKSYSTDLSANGRYVTFLSAASNLVADDSNTKADAFLHDLQTGETTRISTGNGFQAEEDIETIDLAGSSNFAVFMTRAGNLVNGDNNQTYDVFLVKVPISLTPTDPPDAAPERNYYTTAIITLTWNAVTNAADYEIWVADNLNFTNAEIYYSDTLAFTTPALAEGTYYWRVRARRSNGLLGTWSVAESFRIDLSP